jgi:hypothetical protein
VFLLWLGANEECHSGVDDQEVSSIPCVGGNASRLNQEFQILCEIGRGAFGDVIKASVSVLEILSYLVFRESLFQFSAMVLFLFTLVKNIPSSRFFLLFQISVRTFTGVLFSRHFSSNHEAYFLQLRCFICNVK